MSVGKYLQKTGVHSGPGPSPVFLLNVCTFIDPKYSFRFCRSRPYCFVTLLTK